MDSALLNKVEVQGRWVYDINREFNNVGSLEHSIRGAIYHADHMHFTTMN